jgi:hypothetical protein
LLSQVYHETVTTTERGGGREREEEGVRVCVREGGKVGGTQGSRECRSAGMSEGE